MTSFTRHSLDRMLEAARLRLMVAKAAPAALRWIVFLSLVAAVSAPIARRLGAAHPWWLVVLPACGGVAAIVGAIRARPDRRRAASAVDNSHGFHDACSTLVSAPSVARADSTFVALQEEAVKELLGRVDLRRLGSPMPDRPLVAGCVVSLLILGTSLIMPWPEPRSDAILSLPESASSPQIAAAAESEALRESRRVRELAERVEVLAGEGRLEDAERAMDELERRTRELAAREPRGDPSLLERPAEDRRRALIESASSIGDAAESVGRQATGASSPTDPPAKWRQSSAREPIIQRRRADADADGEPSTGAPPSSRETVDDSRSSQAPQQRKASEERREATEPAGARQESREGAPRPTSAGAGEQTRGNAPESEPEQSREGRRDASGEGAREPSSTKRSSEREIPKSGEPSGTGQGASVEAKRGENEEHGAQHPNADRLTTDARPRPAPAGEPNGDRVAPQPAPAPETTSGQAREARQRIRQRLEELSREAGAEAMRGQRGTAPRSSGANEVPPDSRSAGAAPVTDSEITPRRGDESRGGGRDAGMQRGGQDSGATPPAAEARSTYDIEAVRPDPERPGGVVERLRDRDDSAPVSSRAGRVAGQAGAGRVGDPSSDPTVAPRFRPLVARYFERVRPSVGAPASTGAASDSRPPPAGSTTTSPPKRP